MELFQKLPGVCITACKFFSCNLWIFSVFSALSFSMHFNLWMYWVLRNLRSAFSCSNFLIVSFIPIRFYNQYFTVILKVCILNLLQEFMFVMYIFILGILIYFYIRYVKKLNFISKYLLQNALVLNFMLLIIYKNVR